MLKATDSKWTEGDYLNFKDEGLVSPGSKTKKYSVHSRYDGSMLGYVKYFVICREYTFFPFQVVIRAKYLREIAEFCEARTAEQRAKSWGTPKGSKVGVPSTGSTTGSPLS